MRVTLAADYTPGSGALQVSSIEGLPEPPFSLAIVDQATKEIKLDYRVFKLIGGPFLAGEAESEDRACCAGDVVLTPQVRHFRHYEAKMVFTKRY